MGVGIAHLLPLIFQDFKDIYITIQDNNVMSFTYKIRDEKEEIPTTLRKGQKLITYLLKIFTNKNNGLGTIVSVQNDKKTLHLLEVDNFCVSYINTMSDEEFDKILKKSPKEICDNSILTKTD